MVDSPNPGLCSPSGGPSVAFGCTDTSPISSSPPPRRRRAIRGMLGTFCFGLAATSVVQPSVDHVDRDGIGHSPRKGARVESPGLRNG